MNYKIKDHKVAVSKVFYWMPINKDTPRNVKVLAINRRQGVAQFAEIRTDEQWYTHWQAVPMFNDSHWSTYDPEDDQK